MIYLEQLFSNKVIGVSILSWAIAQIIKIIIDLCETKTLDLNLIMSSGGMPSSHSSFVVSLATSVGLREGFNSTAFSVCFVLCMVVMYDAAGVRRAAGKHAAIINKMIENMTKIKIDEKLKELLGHTPVEVAAGAILGVIVSVVAFQFM